MNLKNFKKNKNLFNQLTFEVYLVNPKNVMEKKSN